MGNLRVLVVVSVFLSVSGLVAPASAIQENHCATQPPPAGLVERCRSRTIIVPESELALRFVLTEWMRTCVSSDRAPALVYGADSVETLWELTADLPAYRRAVTIYPEYEALTFTQEGRTCYGVKGVEFRTTKRRTEVDDGEPAVTPVRPSQTVTSEMIKEAARAATRALQNSPSRDNVGLSQFRGVLDGLARYGADFEDTYYPVAPMNVGAGDLNTYSCDKDYTARTGRFDCLPADDAVKACTRHLADDLVTAYQFDKLSGSRFTEMLEIKSNEIYRGFQHVDQAHAFELGGRTMCPALRDAIMPKMGEMAKKGKTTLYGYY
jgi:hypothetical protein